MHQDLHVFGVGKRAREHHAPMSAGRQVANFQRRPNELQVGVRQTETHSLHDSGCAFDASVERRSVLVCIFYLEAFLEVIDQVLLPRPHIQGQTTMLQPGKCRVLFWREQARIETPSHGLPALLRVAIDLKEQVQCGGGPPLRHLQHVQARHRDWHSRLVQRAGHLYHVLELGRKPHCQLLGRIEDSVDAILLDLVVLREGDIEEETEEECKQLHEGPRVIAQTVQNVFVVEER
mmetsp:Transcript_70062/g.194719  ORF Transcript_70062/g.194719 Transcript_70062/m.194719 type:complete len:234 (-) Transcript_70062:960-1661(-)